MLVRFFTTVVLIAAVAPAGAQTLVDVQVRTLGPSAKPTPPPLSPLAKPAKEIAPAA